MSYGKMVFEFLLPTFQVSCCTHYKGDFLESDRREFERTAVPGMTYLWYIRPYGTQLLILGAEDQVGMLETVLKMNDPRSCELYLVNVVEGACKIKEIDVAKAKALAGARVMIETHRAADRLGRTPTLYTYFKAGQCIASATVKVTYDRVKNRSFANVCASISAASDRATQVLVTELIKLACTTEKGDLFWSFGDYLVNEMPFEVWNANLTTLKAGQSASRLA
ncbi:hypothetical protein [Ottowia sp.]|uniref:hypothetical protein n=1 Tax=Ottowia sp. TaxID=1898956 RepID=UPI0025ED4F4F|nr:hypothetical protein [Ottowia sp.]MBK6616447.1 hypothetical protein [Ottowia sp.]